MLRLIKNHNYLNGNIFSLIEFLRMAAIIAPFAGYYLIHGRWLYAAVAIGIVLNCIPIPLAAMQALRKREESIGIVSLYVRKDHGKDIEAEYPNISQETFLLCLAILVPFFLFISSAYEAWIER